MSKLSIVVACVVLLAVGAAIDASQENAVKTIVLDLKSTPDGQLFYVQVQVGQVEEPQMFNMLVATAYPLTWIASKDVSPIRGYAVEKNLSREKKPFGATGVSGMLSIYFHLLDWLKMGTYTLGNQPISVMSTHKGAYFEGQEEIFDGILGLSVQDTIPEWSQNLFKNLQHLSYIDKLIFSLYINNSVEVDNDDNQNQPPKGALVLGGVDNRYFTGDINYIRLHEDTNRRELIRFNKSLIISSIQLDWSKIGKDTRTTMELPESMRTGRVDLKSMPVRLRLDSTTKLFVGDNKILDTIHLNFIGAKQIGHNGVYVFDDCLLNNKPDIVFYLVGMEIVMKPEDYVLNGEIDGKEYCFSAFRGYQTNSYMSVEPIWVFGTRFLRKYYTVFDYENDLIGFATPK